MFIKSLCAIVLFFGIECNALSSDNESAIDTIQQISKSDITAAKYTIFLNAVASKADPHALYDPVIESDPSVAAIRRTQLSSRYFYEVIAVRENITIPYITLNNAMRFCNWLENGAPENIDVNISDALLASITEKGSYEFLKEGDQEIGILLPGAHYYLLNNDEWIQSDDQQSDSTPINSVNNTDLTHQPEKLKGPCRYTSLAIPHLQQIAPADHSLRSLVTKIDNDYKITSILAVLLTLMTLILEAISWSLFPETG